METLVLRDETVGASTVHPLTLGKGAVLNARVLAGHSRLKSIEGAHISHALVEDELSTMRDRLADIKDCHDTTIDIYCENSAPESLISSKESEHAALSWRNWLGQHATSTQLLSFAYMNVGNTARLQTDPEVTHEVEVQGRLYREGVGRGLKEGWLHPDAARVVRGESEIKTYIGDIFDTYCKNDRLGYYLYGGSSIVIAGERANGNNNQTTLRNIRQYSFHERNHAELGDFRQRWIKEAFTEHISEVIKHGKPEILLPKARRPLGRTYENERELGHYVLQNGNLKIPTIQAMQAYSEQSSEGASQLLDDIDLSWGVNLPSNLTFVDALEHYIDNRTKEIEFAGTRHQAAQSQAVAEVTELVTAHAVDRIIVDSRVKQSIKPVIRTSSGWI